MNLQEIFSTGITAARDVLVARASNDPTPNSRGSNDVTAPAGSPAGGNAALAALTSPGTLLMVAAVGVLVYLLVRK